MTPDSPVSTAFAEPRGRSTVSTNHPKPPAIPTSDPEKRRRNSRKSLRSKSPQIPPFDFEAQNSVIEVDSSSEFGGASSSAYYTSRDRSLSLSEKARKSVRSVRSRASSKAASIVDHLNFRAVEPVRIRVRRVRCEANGKGILEGIDADYAPGTLTAILGSSGSGKTTLLNVLANRFNKKSFQVQGSITFNGHASDAKNNAAYVMQDDVLQPTLTVRETLQYAAELRLPGLTSRERRAAVEETILQLGLKSCASTRIGDSDHKGCSGGEKRRTSIGQQLLSNPSVLFLDEPTTGLDATSAFQVVQTLKSLASKGRTVVMTIHQPRSEIWNLFDNITLLSRGRIVYTGLTANVPDYFSSIGHPLPVHANPAEFLIDLSALDYRTEEAEAESKARVEAILSQWKPLPNENTYGKDLVEHAQKPFVPTNVSFARQVLVQTKRTIRTSLRDRLGMTGILVEAIGMALICGWIFYNLDRGFTGIRSRQGALYIAVGLQGYLVLLFEAYRISIDIHVFDREYNEGVVGVTSFLLSRRLGKLWLEDIPVPLLFAIIFYFMTGLNQTVERFMTFFAILLIVHFIAVGVAMISVSVSRDFAKGSVFVNLLYTFMSLSCGYFQQGESLGPQVQWVKWCSYVFYSFAAVVANEFSGEFYDCPLDDPDNVFCAQYRGDYILKTLGIKENWITVPILACVGFAVGSYVFAGILLKLVPVRIEVGNVVKTDVRDLAAGKELLRERTQDTKVIEVVLKDFNLEILKKNPLGIFTKRPTTRKIPILRKVSSAFKPGQLNVIMGPSGSGKSTLLNAMAQRNQNSLMTKYRTEGEMLFNGALPSQSVVRSICSYVTQDDDGLYPALTVRETLHFAALLRLPPFLTRAQKLARADEVIMKLGLKECQNNLIGSEFKKGISGGERRRVSIAVQILTSPKILLLDEPTSGLDSFTATSILEVLQGLAAEGRTIILTIHQSRSDLFDKFGSVLLLARGGYPVYSGPANTMLDYFRERGHNCPSRTNPADFALDVITVDLQRSDREEKSKRKVDKLIKQFDGTAAVSDSLPASATAGSSGQLDHATLEAKRLSQPAELGQFARQQAPFMTAYPVLVLRSLRNLSRDPVAIIARTSQVVGFGIILVYFFTPVGDTYIGVINRLGFLQTVLPLYFVGMLQNVAVYPAERDVFYRDHLDNAYSTTAFFLSYLTIETPLLILCSALYALGPTFATGIPRTAKMYAILTVNAIAIVSAGESIGLIFNTLLTHTGFAVNLTSTILSISTLMAGIMSLSYPSILQALNHLSPLGFSVKTMAPTVFENQVFRCPVELGICPVRSGEEALRVFELEGGRGVWGGLVGVVVGYRVLAWVVLEGRMRGWRWRRG